MLDLSLFENPIPNVYIFKKWDWDYLEAEKFQLMCVDYVQKNPMISLLLVCSHPHCFTMGRGLQKQKDNSQVLVEFDSNIELPYPLYPIKRGGGLTFHYPGQFVFYPIINLTYHRLAVFDLMIKIMEQAQAILEKQFAIIGLRIKKDLLGLWFENDFSRAKLASIGLAATRFNTYHGLALNFFNDEEMFQTLRGVYPCGLPGDIYRALETLSCRKISRVEREHFSDEFLNLFMTSLRQVDHLIMERQRSSSLIIDSISF